MRIIVDAMGGDRAPREIIAGAIEARRTQNVEIVLVGRGETILQHLREMGEENLPQGIEIANAEEVISMEDDPALVVKTRRDSSMLVGLRMLADGAGDAFVSAGSTGALLTAATLIVKRVKGIRRAAMGPVLPTATGRCVLIDCGATVECSPEFLLQFAYMGTYYAKHVLGIASPKVGLLNIGTEKTKGTALQKDAYRLLQQASQDGELFFVGNVEARAVPLGEVDVAVSDGYSGNIFLKTMEGTALLMSAQLKQMFTQGAMSRLSALLVSRGIRRLRQMMDYRAAGGTELIGIQKPVIKAHGSSDTMAICSAIVQAAASVKMNIAAEIAENIQKMRVIEADEDVS